MSRYVRLDDQKRYLRESLFAKFVAGNLMTFGITLFMCSFIKKNYHKKEFENDLAFIGFLYSGFIIAINAFTLEAGGYLDQTVTSRQSEPGYYFSSASNLSWMKQTVEYLKEHPLPSTQFAIIGLASCNMLLNQFIYPKWNGIPLVAGNFSINLVEAFFTIMAIAIAFRVRNESEAAQENQRSFEFH